MNRREFVTLLGGTALTVTAAGNASAQPAGKTYRLGVLTQGGQRNGANWIAFFDELRKQGFIEGFNLVVVDAFTSLDQAEQAATTMVRAQPDAIVTAGVLTRVLQRATQTIPILTVSDDLLAEKVVTSLAHPDGNATGISILATELDGKRQEILLEAFPATQRLAIIADNGVTGHEQLQALASSGMARGIAVSTYVVRSSDEISPAIEAASGAGAQVLNILASSLLHRSSSRIIEQTARIRLPAIYQWPEIAETGGLLGYGPRFVALYRQQAWQVAKVLKGAKPNDIPIEQPTRFELVVNLKTAKNMGLTIPLALLIRADLVIE
jgi:putative ABC transport system substrate-binding protein